MLVVKRTVEVCYNIIGLIEITIELSTCVIAAVNTIVAIRINCTCLTIDILMVERLIVLFVVIPAHGALQCKSRQKRSGKRLCHREFVALIVTVEVALVYVYIGCRTTSTIQIVAILIAITYELESHTTVHEIACIKHRVVIQPVGTSVIEH